MLVRLNSLCLFLFVTSCQIVQHLTVLFPFVISVELLHCKDSLWSQRTIPPKSIPLTAEFHPSVTDPVAPLFSTGFWKKEPRVGKFSTRLPLSVRLLFCLFETYTNDICGECKNGRVKLKFHQVPGRLNFHWVKGKNPLGWVSLGLLQRGVKLVNMTTSFTRWWNAL